MPIYKQLTSQDRKLTPFNAHKQYVFNSSSAAENKVTWYNTRWTSESVSIYSSASSNSQGIFDPINNIKYNQIDNLFYKNFKLENVKRFGKFNYHKQKRELHEKATIVSIPSGLYGQEIKPGSFLLSSSGFNIVDDTYGNLIISGTNINNYPTDLNKNLFRLDPINGFKKYDLSIFDGYAVTYGIDIPTGETGIEIPPWIYRAHYRKGEKDPNAYQTYTTRYRSNKFDSDNSYYNNKIKYNNVTFQTSSFNTDSHKFPYINLSSINTANIVAPHQSRFNFNRDDDFAISFYIRPQIATDNNTIKIGDFLQGGLVFNIDSSNGFAYIVYPEIFSYKGSGIYSNILPAPFSSTTGIGGGETTTAAMVSNGNFPLATTINNMNIEGYTGWWIPNQDEIEAIYQNLGGGQNHPTLKHLAPNNIFSLNNNNFSTKTQTDDNGFERHLAIETSTFTNSNQDRFVYYPGEQYYEILNGDIVVDAEGLYVVNSNFAFGDEPIPINSNGNPNFNNYLQGIESFVLPVRKVNLNTLGMGEDNIKRYIISKSTTKTIVPTANEATSGQMAPNNEDTLGTTVEGNLQFANVNAEAQFPYEIYMVSSSLYFDRSDGSNTVSINYEITGSGVGIYKDSHIVCQNSSSVMQIWFDGTLVKESANTKNILKEIRLQNNANLYIGSKGINSTNDSTDIFSNEKMYNGNIGYINIFDHFLLSSSITPMSESVNNSPYIGNLFYQQGLGIISHPRYKAILEQDISVGDYVVGDNFIVGSEEFNEINGIKFQGTLPMYEHEYKCTIQEHEFNNTTNITARKIKTQDNKEFADFTTGSYFKPYVTTIGLYNENNELLVIGKLGQPVKMSDKTDTTFVLRWDT